MDVKYNNYSSELNKIFDEAYAACSPRNPMKFMLEGIRYDPIMKKHIVPQSSTIGTPVDRIFDPYAVKKGKEYEGAEIDIAYVTGSTPSGPNSTFAAQINLGEISFKRESVGSIESYGNQAMKELCRFLFFSNRNQSNLRKPWHIEPRFGYIFHQHSVKEANASKLTGAKLVLRAKNFIEGMNESEIDKFKRGLFPNEYSVISDDEVVLKLMAIADKDPAKILGLSQNADVEANRFITKIVESGLLECEEGKKMWVWGDTKKMLCMIKPGQDKISSIKSFFQTEAGLETAELLEQLMNKEKQETE